ncbi:hypothetical protein D3C75_1291900 [compost metagenome]
MPSSRVPNSEWVDRWLLKSNAISWKWFHSPASWKARIAPAARPAATNRINRLVHLKNLARCNFTPPQ